jgi:hypothetical protein
MAIPIFFKVLASIIAIPIVTILGVLASFYPRYSSLSKKLSRFFLTAHIYYIVVLVACSLIYTSIVEIFFLKWYLLLKHSYLFLFIVLVYEVFFRSILKAPTLF